MWRHLETGAAVGYIPQNGFAVTFGSPLCDPIQLTPVIKAYLAHLQEKKLKPIWCCIDAATEKVLATTFGWTALTAVAEERINPSAADDKEDKGLKKKVHKAEKYGVKLIDVEGEMDESLKNEINERVEDWKMRRKGTQIHLTGVRPFDDMEHRKYFYARDAEGKVRRFSISVSSHAYLISQICALVVLAQLSTAHGFQIKWALEFHGAPLGAIEVCSHMPLHTFLNLTSQSTVHPLACHQEDGQSRCSQRHIWCWCRIRTSSC